MTLGASYDKILAEAEQVARVWEANPTFTLGDLKLSDLRSMISDLRAKRTEVNDNLTTRTRLVNEANDMGKALRSLTGRIRGGYKATFGPNSSQYDQAGGTRETERKPPKSSRKSS